ncbi:MAG: hypothetical protein ABSA93_09245 [Streptosporangiaceae bacterium]
MAVSVSLRRRMLTLVLIMVAEAIAIGVVVTGPPESVAFDLRLPLLIAAAGAAVTAAQWQRRVIWMPPEVEPDPVLVTTPMASPWLVLNATTGVMFLAAKGYESHPALIEGVLVFSGTVGLLALGAAVAQWLRPERANRAEFLGEGGQPYRAQ